MIEEKEWNRMESIRGITMITLNFVKYFFNYLH